MRALITGGAGFIGSYLVESLLAKGWQVLAMDDLSTGSLANLKYAESIAAPEQLRFVKQNILDSNLLEEWIASSDQVYHLAAAVGVRNIVERPLTSLKCNVKGTEIVLEWCAKHKKKVYLASTSEVYGNLNQIPFCENAGSLLGASTKLRWSYAAGKLIDEFLAIAYFREQGLPVVIGRHFNTVGPRQSPAYGMVIPKFIEQALGNKPITVFGDGKQTRTFTHVNEAVKIVLDLMLAPKDDRSIEGEVFNIGGPEEISILDLAHRIKDLTRSTSSIELISYDRVYNDDFEDMPRRVPDGSKLFGTLGYQPQMSLNEILVDAIQFARGDRA